MFKPKIDTEILHRDWLKLYMYLEVWWDMIEYNATNVVMLNVNDKNSMPPGWSGIS